MLSSDSATAAREQAIYDARGDETLDQFPISWGKKSVPP